VNPKLAIKKQIAELKLGHSSPVIYRADKLIFNKANSCRGEQTW